MRCCSSIRNIESKHQGSDAVCVHVFLQSVSLAQANEASAIAVSRAAAATSSAARRAP